MLLHARKQVFLTGENVVGELGVVLLSTLNRVPAQPVFPETVPGRIEVFLVTTASVIEKREPSFLSSAREVLE
jgi:hypothetical protein